MCHNLGFLMCCQVGECLEYIHKEFFFRLESIMIGASDVPEGLQAFGDKVTVFGAGSVAKELEKYRENGMFNTLSTTPEVTLITLSYSSIIYLPYRPI